MGDSGRRQLNGEAEPGLQHRPADGQVRAEVPGGGRLDVRRAPGRGDLREVPLLPPLPLHGHLPAQLCERAGSDGQPSCRRSQVRFLTFL